MTMTIYASADASSDKDATDDNAFDDANYAVVDNIAAVDNANINTAVDEANNNAANDASADASTAASAYNPANSSDSDEEMTDGTIVPGTQVNYNPIAIPYYTINARPQHHAESMLVDPPCILGINPDHETWIRKMMLDDWGICHPHEFQICTIH